MKWCQILFIVTFITYAEAFSFVSDMSFNNFTNLYITTAQTTDVPLQVVMSQSEVTQSDLQQSTYPEPVKTASAAPTTPRSPAPAAPATTATPQSTQQTESRTSDLLKRLTWETWSEAIERRRVANYLGGGTRSGNRSKGMCASAVKDALLDSGVCTSRPEGNAAVTHTSGSLRRHCPNLHLVKQASSRNRLDISDIHNAPGGSLIVYNGYAGTRPHKYGHIEMKIPVTQQTVSQMRQQGLQVSVGDFVYCSDFCSTRPTKKSTNSVIAIYSI